jgi:DNA polymerase
MDREQLVEHLRFAAELGVDGVSRDPAWRRRGDAPPPVIPVARSADEALAAIKREIGPDCARCKLHRLGRRQVVFGVGNPDADLMFVGEAPGADEDLQGEPFVGRAGQLLDAMLRAVGRDRRSNVFVANVLKCRPPNNRDPKPEEIACCLPYLERQIAWIEPKLILGVGRIAAQSLLGTDAPIGRLRGRVHRFGASNTPLVVTYHPAYLLRAPAEKRKAWDDLKLAQSLFLQLVQGR